MPTPNDLRDTIATALSAFGTLPLPTAARGFFSTLGYASERTILLASPSDFIDQFDPNGRLSERERTTLCNLSSLHLLFQITDAELTAQLGIFDDPQAVHAGEMYSYLFFAAELPDGHYTRTDISSIARAINKPLLMPALVLLKHGDSLSLVIIHRRLNKRYSERDVLEKATLIKDIRIEDPIRAHLEILNDFVFANLAADFNVSNFADLHDAWQKRLGSYALSNDFYREIADWYFWAHHLTENGSIVLPSHCDTEQEKSLFLIRLLTRVIFCWFLVEKRLIPPDLFRDRTLRLLLKDISPSASTYYHAVLQNLFFGTLNMPSDNRGFRERKKEGERFDPNFGITNLWRYEEDFQNSSTWVKLAERIPFLNGGLFDCLDDKVGKRQDNTILDGFSDNPKLSCQLPNDLFFGPERTVDLSKDYGEETKKTARSKRAKVRGLIEILSRYKFTIEENTPLEEEIALDPELLGKVFENLLASYNEDTRTSARKALGAFYTPREIVSYMVDEALKSYLATQVPRCKGALDDLFSNKATLKEIKPDTRDALVAAIGRVKILDPACGSGAFPMGALHRLVDLLQKLDANNESWKRDRLAEAETYRKVLEETGAPKEEVSACEARMADIRKSFDSRFHALDYARKLYLIENGIYGVDIQPVAVQIAKLRFFISLVVDQKVNMNETNLGVRPLPNLETRLVAADTLIPLESRAKQANLFDNDSGAFQQQKKLGDELKRIRHEHFNARDPGRKRQCREEDRRVREEMRDLLTRTGTPSKSAKDMAHWDPYDQNASAPFFDSGWMFGLPVGKFRVPRNAISTMLGKLSLVNDASGQMELETLEYEEIESGFDIIIGNPPYVSSERFSRTAQQEKWKDVYECYASRIDIYCLFYERGLKLLKQNGVLTYISSNKFMRAGYGVKFRPFIAKNATIDRMIDFGELPVFTAATDTAVVLVRREKPKGDNVFIGASIKKAEEIFALQNAVRTHGVPLKQSELQTEGWTFALQSKTALATTIKSRGEPLKELVHGQFFRGIITGLNEAFVISERTRQELIEEDPRSEELIKPWLQGREIKRWFGAPSGLYVILVRYGFHEQLDQYPAIRKHLNKFAAKLKQRGQCTSSRNGDSAGQHHWLELDNNPSEEYLGLFEGPKVVFNETSKELHAFVDHDGLYINKTGFIFVAENPDYILAILMSKVLDWLYRMEFPNWGDPWKGGRIQFRGDRMAKVPIVGANPAEEKSVARISQLLASLSKSSDAHNTLPSESLSDPLMPKVFETILNGLVYELYFHDELHSAGLHIFDLVAQANLPDINSIPEPERMKAVTSAYEVLLDSEHPLQQALKKLQTLDFVRIIEGKA